MEHGAGTPLLLVHGTLLDQRWWAPQMEPLGERYRVVAPSFAGMSRVARHRAINDLLKPELDAGLHALAVEPAAPGEPTGW